MIGVLCWGGAGSSQGLSSGHMGWAAAKEGQIEGTRAFDMQLFSHMQLWHRKCIFGFWGVPSSRALRSDDDNQQQTKAKLHTAATTPWSRQNWAPLPRYPYPTPAVQPSPFFLLAPLNSRRPTTLVVLNEENMHKNHGILCTLQSSVGPPTLSHIRQSVWSYLPFAAHPPPLPLISMRAREREGFCRRGRPRHQT